MKVATILMNLSIFGVAHKEVPTCRVGLADGMNADKLLCADEVNEGASVAAGYTLLHSYYYRRPCVHQMSPFFVRSQVRMVLFLSAGFLKRCQAKIVCLVLGSSDPNYRTTQMEHLRSRVSR